MYSIEIPYKVQPKLKTGQPNDQCKKEVGEGVDQVMGIPTSKTASFQRKYDAYGTEQLQMNSFQDDIAPISQKQLATSDLVQMQGQASKTASSSNSSTPVVDRIDVIKSSGGFSGFPVVKGVDLNKPGKYNLTTGEGSVMNIHQIAFHLSQGSPNDVKLLRCVDRVGRAGDKAIHKTSLDGPSLPTVVRSGKNIVVADSPGYRGTKKKDKEKPFPVSYIANFKLYAYDMVTKKVLASVDYVVVILKNKRSQASPVNRIGAIEKKFGPRKIDRKMCK